ncbi:MAG: hypothetical protein HYZ39_21675 [Mycolicibacterium cosmeticum]|nr:hypothetical protein [Mycolicibacterium cosmeticum]
MGRHRAEDRSEEDVAGDPNVATSRASDGDGAYVGRTTPDDAIDTEESGAEARADREL